jgi:hypothetical protein
MTDEERQRQMDFILDQQAQFAVNMQKLEEADTRSNKRIDRLEQVLVLAIRNYRRERKETREKLNALVNAQVYTEEVVDKIGESHTKLAKSLTKLTESHVKLAESQTHADKRLDALIDIVQGWKQ